MEATAMDRETGQEAELPLQHALPQEGLIALQQEGATVHLQGSQIVLQREESTVHLQGHPIVRRHAHQHQTILLQRDQVEPGVGEPE
jgi:hypothetical protein